MLSIGPTTRVYLRPGATDLRLGYEALFPFARAMIGAGADPLVNQQVFAFCNHSRTRLKLLLHDGSGLWLCAKRLDAGRYRAGAGSGRSGDGGAVVGASLRTGGERLEKHWRR